MSGLEHVPATGIVLRAPDHAGFLDGDLVAHSTVHAAAEQLRVAHLAHLDTVGPTHQLRTSA